MLAVADSASAAEAQGMGDCSGLWQLRHASGVSSRVHLDAVVATEPPPGPASSAGDSGGGSSDTGRLVVSAALAPLNIHLSGQQAAALAAVVDAVATEAEHQYQTPLLLQEVEPAEQAGAAPAAAWLSSCTLAVDSGMQLAYVAAGGLQRWRGPQGAGIAAAPAAADGCRSGSGGADATTHLYVALGGITAAVTASPAAAGAHGQRRLVLQAQLVQPHAWVLPSLAVQVPAAEARLGLASADHSSTVLLAEPLLLLAGACYGRQQEHSTVQLSSVSVSVGAADYPLLASLVRCWRQQPALPPRPTLCPAAALLGAAEQPVQQQAARAAAAPQAAGATEGEVDKGQAVQSGLVVRIDAASLTVWAQPLQQQQGSNEQVQQHGVAVWLSQLQLSKQQAEGGGNGSSSEVTLVAAHAALVRQRQPGSSGDPSSGPLEFSPVLSFPATVERQQAQEQEHEEQWRQPALMLTWSSSQISLGGSLTLSPSKGPSSGGSRLQLHAMPISLTFSRDLVAAVGTIVSDLGGSEEGQEEEERQQQQQQVPSVAAHPPEEEPEPLQGKAALQGVRVVLLEAARWEDEQREEEATVGEPWRRRRRFDRPAAAGVAAVEVEIEEAVLLLQQVPAAENRPWLAGSRAAAALITLADASLIGAAITVWHAGELAALHGPPLSVACLWQGSSLSAAFPLHVGRAGRQRGAADAQAPSDPVLPLPLRLQAPRVPIPRRCCRPPTAACSCCCSRTRVPWASRPTCSCCLCRCPCQRWLPYPPSSPP